MSFLPDIFSATIKAALTPVAIVKDVVNVAIGEDPNATKELLEDAVKDAEKAMDSIT